MPVEIRELVIRAVVNGDQEAHQAPAEGSHLDEHAVEAIVEECVRQVLKILKKQGDR